MVEKGLKPFFLLLAIGMIGTMGIKAGFKHEITIEDVSETVTLNTFSHTVEDAIEAADIKLYDGDVVTPSLETAIDDNMTIMIARAKPVTIIEGDVTHIFRTTKIIVSDILADAGISLDENDQVYPRPDEVIALDCKIEVVRIEVSYEEEEDDIPYSTVYKMTDELTPGQTIQLVAGENGKARYTFKVVYENGEMVSRQLENEEILLEPVSEVVEEGIDKLLVTSRGMPFRYKEVIVMKATAYDLSYESCGKYPGDPDYGITRSGTQARPGVVAVDPRVIALGSKLYVESLDGTSDYGFSSAEDTGSAIKGNRVDLFIENRSQALRYGVRYVRVYVLDESFDDSLMVGYAK